MIVNIHLEWVEREDNGKRLEKVIGLGKPVILSPVPLLFDLENRRGMFGTAYPADYAYPERVVEILKEAVQEKHVTLGQQGDTHHCPECEKSKETRDPFHEFRCLYGPTKSVEEQAAIMRHGKEILEDVLGASPRVFVPPNHQFNDNTCEAFKQVGYEYFTTRGVLHVVPHRQDGLVILPERKFSPPGHVIYTHYHEMTGEEGRYFELIEGSEPLRAVAIAPSVPRCATLNSYLVTAGKFGRDFRKFVPVMRPAPLVPVPRV